MTSLGLKIIHFVVCSLSVAHAACWMQTYVLDAPNLVDAPYVLHTPHLNRLQRVWRLHTHPRRWPHRVAGKLLLEGPALPLTQVCWHAATAANEVVAGQLPWQSDWAHAVWFAVTALACFCHQHTLAGVQTQQTRVLPSQCTPDTVLTPADGQNNIRYIMHTQMTGLSELILPLAACALPAGQCGRHASVLQLQQAEACV